MSYQAPKDEILQRLCKSSDVELCRVFESCTGREVYSESLRSLVRDLAEEHQLRERNTLIARLQSWITEGQNGKGANSRYLRYVKDVKLRPFGSSVMGISNRDGDLDISLEGCLTDKSISPTGRLSDALRGFKGDLLAEVHEILKKGQHFRYSKHPQLIRHAKVPVSKFVEPHTGIHCDLSIGNTTGVFKSNLLAEVLKIDDRVRDLVVIIKKWAKANHINDPANGSFNSYCLTLLVLSFAQSRSPPLIPSFRELFSGLRDVVCESQRNGEVDLLEEIKCFKEKAKIWHAQFQQEDRRNTESLCELLCAFFLSFSLFATHSQLLHYTAEGVSKSNSRPTSSCWDSGYVLSAWDANALKRYQLFVEDPFEAKDNCARTLATQDWWRIVKTLQETVNLVQEFTYALPSAQPEKWHVLWSFLFQHEPLPPLPERSGFNLMEFPPQRPKALMPLHKECLIEHLIRFKASDKKFIAVSYSWWSKEFKQFVMSAIEALKLFQGKGPKKKIIISKANNIKEDMVEHAVNSTLRARKTHNQVVDPYSCIIKQRLAEFLRCAIRFHKFRASYFDDEIKDWLMQCVVEAGLKGKFVDGDLQLERPADLRPMIVMESPHVGIPATLEAPNPRKDLLPMTPIIPPPPPEPLPSDDLAILGPLELEEQSGRVVVLDSIQVTKEDTPDEDEDEELWCEGTEIETCLSSCGELGTSYEHSYRNRGVISNHAACNSNSGVSNSVLEFVKVHFEVVDESKIKLHLMVMRSTRRSSTRQRVTREEIDLHPIPIPETIRLSISVLDGQVCVSLDVRSGLVPSRGLLAELGTVDEEGRDGTSLQEENEENDKILILPKSHGGDSGIGIPSQQATSSASMLTNGLHNRNAEILRLVFLDLFDTMEKLQDTDSFRGEIEIDPTEYVVPVSWVRQQVRDIARHLVLEIVVPNKRKRPMKIRIRKRARFEESDSDEEYEFGRNGSYNRVLSNGGDHYYFNDQKLYKRDILDRFQRFPPVRMVDEEDHVTKCLLWIKGMKREKSMHFQYGIYPQDVMHCLKERAEELGLRLEVRDNAMFIGINPHLTDQQIEETPKMSLAKLAALNEKVQSSIREYFTGLMIQSRTRGADRFTVQTKGYFMRPEWVSKQVVEIGRGLGFEVAERDGMVEFMNMPPLPPPLKQPPDQGLARYFSMPSPTAAAPFPIPIPPPASSSSHIRSGLARSHSVNYYPSNSAQEGMRKISCFNGFKLGGGSAQTGPHVMESRSFSNIDEEMKALRQSNSTRKGTSPPTDGNNLALLWNKSSGLNNGNQKSSSSSGRRMKQDHRQNQRRQSPKNGGGMLQGNLWRKENEPKLPHGGNPPSGAFVNGNNRNGRPRGKTRRGRGGRGRNQQQSTEQTSGVPTGGATKGLNVSQPPPLPPSNQS
eukprot:g3241.t1